jgi:Icc-related predicted phosphoesterase
MRFVILSDTHSLHRRVQVPDGDVLLFAGDSTRKGELAELAEFNDWLKSLPHATKIVIAGNRDFCFETKLAESKNVLGAATYLQDETLQVGGFQIYGSPWQPPFLNMAFNLERGEPLRAKWALIPTDTDILITHTPPYGIGDKTQAGQMVGDRDLTDAVGRIQPKLHVFGHIHEAYGKLIVGSTLNINGSAVDAKFQPVHAPWVIDL